MRSESGPGRGPGREEAKLLLPLLLLCVELELLPFDCCEAGVCCTEEEGMEVEADAPPSRDGDALEKSDVCQGERAAQNASLRCRLHI